MDNITISRMVGTVGKLSRGEVKLRAPILLSDWPVRSE